MGGFTTVSAGIHDDSNHAGTAKRDTANGVAGLNASAKVPDANLESPVATHAALTTAHGGVLQTAAMKDVASGIAGLTAAKDAPHIVKKAASANIRNSHVAEITSASLDYVKLKTITLPNGLVGAQRFIFDIRTNNSPEPVYGRIYRNGVALGTEQSDTTGTYVSKSQDITQTWAPGDTCELWGRKTLAATVFLRNFYIAYDDSPTVAVGSSNS